MLEIDCLARKIHHQSATIGNGVSDRVPPVPIFYRSEKTKDQAPIAMLNAGTAQTGYCLGAHLSPSGTMRKEHRSTRLCAEELVASLGAQPAAGSHAEATCAQEITVSTSSHEDFIMASKGVGQRARGIQMYNISQSWPLELEGEKELVASLGAQPAAGSHAEATCAQEITVSTSSHEDFQDFLSTM